MKSKHRKNTAPIGDKPLQKEKNIVKGEALYAFLRVLKDGRMLVVRNRESGREFQSQKVMRISK